MKRIISTIMLKTFFLACCLFSIVQVASAQEKVHFSNVNQIKASEIELKQKGSTAVKYIKSGSLKNGQNSLTLPSGNILYIESSNKQIKSVTLTKPDGTRLGLLRKGSTVVKYICDGPICGCSGDEDCNDMFTHANCGDFAFCSDNYCYCITL